MSDGIATAPAAPEVSVSESTETQTPENKDLSAVGKSSIPKAPASEPKEPSASAPKPRSESESGDSDSETRVEAAAETATEKKVEEEIKKEIRKLKLKVNGQEREYSEEEVIRKAQMAESADERFKQASEKHRIAEQFLQALKTNPLAVLTHPDLGIDFRDIATQYLGEEYRKETMAPEDLEREQMRHELETYRSRDKEAADQQQQQQQTQRQEQLRGQYQQDYDTKITQALNEVNLPKNPYSIKKVAQLMANALDYGYDLDAKTAAEMVYEQHLSDMTQMFGALDGDNLLRMVGPDLAKKIRKHDLAQIKSKLASSEPSTPAAQVDQSFTAPRRSSGNTKEYLSPDDWREMLRKKAGI